MLVKETVKAFEALGLGMFVHFGLYSLIGKGEWSRHLTDIDPAVYEGYAKDFCPKPDWAKELAQTASQAGCKYITLTSRHHDGFSLYDTCGLSDFDAPHYCGRDLIREFVDACNAEGLIPFFYHTLLDWRHPDYDRDFPAYLAYLRQSVAVLCQNYGKIGGLWFDGKWNKPDADWEEDALYGTIRSYQPDAIIINNTGLSARGEAGHIELDGVTFERGMPTKLPDNAPKYLAGEMCEVLSSHWGYAEEDLGYKSPADLIRTLAGCRKCGANLLLNVGPMGDGSLRLIDRGMLEILGQWVGIYDEAIRLPRPVDVEIPDHPRDFLLRHDNAYYLFCDGLRTYGDINVVVSSELQDFTVTFPLNKTVKSVTWMDTQEALSFTQKNGMVSVVTTPFTYGRQTVIRVAKLVCEA